MECVPGNERVYHWLRQNPHRMNLMRIGLVWRSCGAGAAQCFEEIGEAEIDAVRQELHLESGMLESRFEAGGMPFFITSCCAWSGYAGVLTSVAGIGDVEGCCTY